MLKYLLNFLFLKVKGILLFEGATTPQDSLVVSTSLLLDVFEREG